MTKLLGFLAFATFVSAMLFHGVAQAQYPPPIGNVQAQASSTTASTQTNVTITCIVLGPNGAPMGGIVCTTAVDSEPGGPGGDVSLGSKVVQKVTDASGRVTTNLYTGSTPGVIQVSVTANGLQSRVLVQVTGAPASTVVVVPPGSSASALPPAAPIDQPDAFISPPSTGDAGLASTSNGLGAMSVLLVLAIVVYAGTLAVRPRMTDGE